MQSSGESNPWIRGQRNIQKRVEENFNGQKIKTWNKWDIMGNCFWVVVYLAGIVLTALTCNDLYQKYKIEFASINITVIHNHTFSIPDPTFCLPYFHAEELIDYEYTVYPWNETFVNYSEEYNELSGFYTNELHQFFNNCTSWQEAREQDWPLTLLHVAQVYLAAIYETESLNGNGKYPMDYVNDLSDNTTQSITEALIPKMNEWKVTLGKFRDAFTQQFKRFYRISASLFISQLEEFMNRRDKYLHMISIEERNQELVFVSRYQVCYKLKLNNLDLNQSSIIRITINHINETFILNPGSQSYFPGRRELNYFTDPVVIDMSGKRRAGIRTRPADATFFARFSSVTHLTVKPYYHYTPLEAMNGNQRCSPYETKEECGAKCRRDSIAALCNCTATSLDWLPTNTHLSNNSSCQFGQYEMCLRNFTGTEDSDCMNTCLDLCAPWSLSMESAEYEGLFLQKSGNAIDFVAILEIKVVMMDYLNITEYSDWSVTKVTGVVGGALSFWLGVDIFTIIYYIIMNIALFLKDRCYLKFIKRNNTSIELENGDIQSGKAEKLWQWFIKTFNQSSNLLNLSKSERFNWIMKKIIWSSLFFIGLALAVKDLVPLFISYKNNGTTFSLNVQFNTTIRLPDIAVCGPIDATWKTGSTVMHESIPVALDHLYDRSKFDAYFNKKTMTRDIFLNETESWPPVVFWTVLLYMQAVHQVTISTYGAMLNYWRHSSGNTKFVPWIEFRSILIKWSITDIELERKFTNEFINWQRIKAECTRASESDGNFSLIPTISWHTTYYMMSSLSPTTLCLHFPLSHFDFNTSSDTCSFQMDQNMHWLDTNRYITVKTSESYSNFIDLPLNNDIRFDITFGYSTIYEKLESATCSNDNLPLLDCMSNCRNKMIDDYCENCTIMPLDGTQNISEQWRNVSEWEKYEECLTLTVEPIESCVSKCQEHSPCTRVEYKLYKVISSNPNLVYNRYAAFNLNVKDFSYSLMRERPTWTTEEFVAACGGVLGFWVGLDVTFIIQIIFTPLMFCIGFCIRKKDSTTSTTNTNRHFALDYIAKMNGITYKGVSRLMLVKALFERQFWIAVYAWFAILTANHCVHYIKQYGSALGSNFELMRNEAFTIPATTVCIPLNAYILRSSVDKEHDAGGQLISERNATKEMILDSNLRWPNHLLQTTLLYLTLMEGYKTPTDWSLIWNRAMSQSGSEMEAFSEKMNELQIIHQELIEKFHQEVRRRLWSEVTKYALVNGLLVKKEIIIMERITFLSSRKICYALPDGALSFSSPLEYFQLQIHRRTPSSNFGVDQCYKDYEQYRDNAMFITIDLLGRDNGDEVDDQVLTTGFGSDDMASISIARAVRVMPIFNGQRRCSSDTSRTFCVDQCRVNTVKDQCGCIPNECNIQQLDKCVPNLNKSDFLQCTDGGRCRASCERISYKFDTNYIPGGLNSNYCKAEYMISVSNFQYPLFSESLDTSFFDFIAAFGGLMSIWLPLDIIFFINGFILLGKRLFFKKKLKRKKDQKDLKDRNLESKKENIDDLNIQTQEIE